MMPYSEIIALPSLFDGPLFRLIFAGRHARLVLEIFAEEGGVAEVQGVGHLLDGEGGIAE